MREIIELFIHFLYTLAKLSKPGSVKLVMAETLATKHQLIVISRGKIRAPKLTTSDRFLFGFLAFFIGENRLQKIAVIIKPATILRFHHLLVKRKYRQIYSNKSNKRPGRKGPDQALIELVIEIKTKNASMGYLRISMQIYQAFGVKITPFAVGRILRKHFKNTYSKGDGPSWLTFIGNMKDSLWSVDLFKYESVFLTTHTVMVVMDQYTRMIVGFAVHRGDCDGIAYCRMFNAIVSSKNLPKYLSSDNDPLFRFHRWKANLRIFDIEEIKTVPETPVSHPFVERLIKSVKNEFLDQQLFFNQYDLQNKLEHFQKYFNEERAHSSLEMQTPKQMASDDTISDKIISIDNYRWKSHCRGLYKLPIAA